MKEIIVKVPDDFGKSLKPYKENGEIIGDIVRCKDCKYASSAYDRGYRYCEYWLYNFSAPIYIDGMCYCSYGKRGAAG